MPTKPLKKSIPIPFSPAIKGDSGPPIIGPPYGFRFPYYSHTIPICFSGFGTRTIRMGPKASHVTLGVPEVPNSTWIQSPTGRNPRCEVLAAAEVYKIMAAAEALATDLDMRKDDGCKVSGLQSEKLKPLVGNVKIIQSETQACWIHEDFGWFRWVFLSFLGRARLVSRDPYIGVL